MSARDRQKPESDSTRMTPRAYERRSRLLMFVLGVLIGAVVLVVRHGDFATGPDAGETAAPPAEEDSSPVDRLADALAGAAGVAGTLSGASEVSELLSGTPEMPAPDAPAVHAVELVRQGYFEAQVKVRYTAGREHQDGRGYLYLFERDHPGSTSVGAFVKAGTRTAKVYLDRRPAREDSYVSEQIVALMWRYQTSESPFFEQDIALRLHWPGLREAGVRNRAGRFPDVRQLQVFRNIPRYEALALDLVERGFRTGQMSIMYAPCRKCRAGLHFGPQVRVEALQEVLAALQAHGAPVQWIDYNNDPSWNGYIAVGWTPTGTAKPLWEHLDRLLVRGLTLQEFHRVIGLPAS